MKTIFILATVYFAPGKKNPIMIIDGYEFLLHRRRETRSAWTCAGHIKYKCKVRILTTGRLIQIKKVAHSHERTFKGNTSTLPSQRVNFAYTDKLALAPSSRSDFTM